MERDIKVRKLTQDILMFVWFKHRIMLEEPSPELRFIPEITSQLMNKLRDEVWIMSFLCDCLWRGFFRNHFKRMTSSLELFTTYVTFACFKGNENVTHARARFIGTLSLVTYFVLRCWEAGSKGFLHTCVDFFCAFFEKELCREFEDKGGWKRVNEYIAEETNVRNRTPLMNENVRSFEHFYQQQDENVEIVEQAMKSQFMVLQKLTQTEVETDYKTVIFAESVADRMGELCQKTFDELLADFAKTDRQVEELYRQTVGETSGGLTKEVKYFPTPKIGEASENLPTETKSEKKKLVKQIVTTSHTSDNRNLDIYIPKVDEPNKEPSYLSPKSNKARKLLGDITMDISKLSVLIQSLCEEHGIQVRTDSGVQSF